MVLSAIVDISERKGREDSLRTALREKDLLLSEIHHRVKNNLQVIQSLLALQSSKIMDATALQLLVESQNRIKTMALIHQMLYESKDFGRVDFGGFLEALAPDMMSSYGAYPGRVSLLINAATVLLPIDVAIPCGLIVNELVSNALKHAFPGEARGHIAIELVRIAADQAMLSVSDDGVGIPEALDVANASSLGLQMITLLADQLAATLAIERFRPTRFALRFRVAP